MVKNSKFAYLFEIKKQKKHGALTNYIFEGSMIFVFSKSEKKYATFEMPETQEISTV